MKAVRVALMMLAFALAPVPSIGRNAPPQTGIASWYGPGFHRRTTASGETFDRNGLTAASPSLPLPCKVRVTNLANGRALVLRVNDRGPYVPGRILDVSEHAADVLGFRRQGMAPVRVDVISDNYPPIFPRGS